MSKKYDNFLSALEALCKAHGVLVEQSIEDTLQVFDVDVAPASDYFHVLFEDKTTE